MTIRNALLVAGALLAFSFAVSVAHNSGAISDELSRRAVQVALGLVVVYYANLAPKTLEPLAAKCDPARAQAAQRFSGWALVIGGLGYSLTWLVAPLEHADVIATTVLASALALVIVRCVWTFGRGRQQAGNGA